MKNIILLLLLINVTPIYSQIAWENKVNFEALNLISTRDSGCIVSGRSYNPQINLVKLDKKGKKEWEKELFFGKTNVLIETNDGYLGSSYNDEYNTVKDSLIFKINRKGETIYKIPKKYGNKMKLANTNMVLIYNDSLIKFNHVQKSFLWAKKYGQIYDIKIVSNNYELLTNINNSLQHIKLDTNGNLISQKIIATSLLMYSALFYYH